MVRRALTTSVDPEAERRTFKAFLATPRRERVLMLLEREGGRERVKGMMAHCSSCDPRFVRRIPRGSQGVDDVVRLLREAGAPSECLAVAFDEEIDGRWVPLDLAVARVHPVDMPTLLICIPGRLAYFQDEEPHACYLLAR